jgi:membrane-associated protease RseP (regulator of RpoE activity)
VQAEASPRPVPRSLCASVFGYGTFWVTGTEPSAELPGAVLFRGNLRGGKDATTAYNIVREGTQRLFGTEKYALFVEEEPPPLLGSLEGGPPPSATGEEEPARIAFLLAPTALVTPPPTSGLQLGLAGLLVLLSLGACLELGLEAQLAQLPKETLEFFASPEALQTLPEGTPIPGLEAIRPASLLAAAAPITLGVLSVAAAHEAGHALAARVSQVKLGPPFLIPNISLGCFGSVFDVAIAGPVAGGAAAAALFLAGLAASGAAQAALPGGGEEVRAAALAAGLVPVPPQLLQSSLLLGSVSSAFLHAAPGQPLWVHPAFVAGWCGLTATALNSLPVGQLDGGRVALAAWGKRGLSALSVGVYAGLALGLLAGPLSLSWGLFVLVAQRRPERAPLDSVSPIGPPRKKAAVAMVVLALFALLPLSLELPPMN